MVVAQMQRKEIELGTRFGRLTTTSPIRSKDFTHRKRAVVDVLCDCGESKTAVSVEALRCGHTRSCGCLPHSRWGEDHHAWLGARHPRPVSRFRNELYQQQAGLCAWPPCGLLLIGRCPVDHNHLCCDYKASLSCGRCIRGLVHTKCNHEIGYTELAASKGYVKVIDLAVQDYLDRGAP